MRKPGSGAAVGTKTVAKVALLGWPGDSTCLYSQSYCRECDPTHLATASIRKKRRAQVPRWLTLHRDAGIGISRETGGVISSLAAHNHHHSSPLHTWRLRQAKTSTRGLTGRRQPVVTANQGGVCCTCKSWNDCSLWVASSDER